MITVLESEREVEAGPSRKKRCVGEEKRLFQDKWTNSYFVLPHGLDKVMGLICKQVNATLRDFNIKHHYDTNHKTYDKFTGEGRTGKLQQFNEATLHSSQFSQIWPILVKL